MHTVFRTAGNATESQRLARPWKYAWLLSRRFWSLALAALLVLIASMAPARAEKTETVANTVRRYEGILKYPGPLRNPIGFHWNASASPDAGAVRSALPLLKSMNAGWVKLVAGGDAGVASAKVLSENGIEPIVRLYIAGPHPDYRADPATVRKYIAAGVHYFETGNEPNSPEEWKSRILPPNSAELLADQWTANSKVIRDEGGVPLFFAMMPGAGGKELYRAIFEVLRVRGQLGSFDGAAIAVHNRPFNHPLDYPDDPVNKRDGRWTNIHQDDTSFRSYEVFDDIAFEFLGRSLPLLATEAGYAITSNDDNRYPSVTVASHRQGNLDIITGFRDGRWRDSLINQNFWVLGAFGHPGWAADVWLANPENGGRDLPAIDALRSLSPFKRNFFVDKYVQTTTYSSAVNPPPPFRFRQGSWEATITVSDPNPSANSYVGVNVQISDGGRPAQGSRVDLEARYQNHQAFDRFPDTDGEGRTVRAIGAPMGERSGTWDFVVTSQEGIKRTVSIGIQISEATPTPAPTSTPTPVPTSTTVPVPPSPTPSPTLTPPPRLTATTTAISRR